MNEGKKQLISELEELIEILNLEENYGNELDDLIENDSNFVNRINLLLPLCKTEIRNVRRNLSYFSETFPSVSDNYLLRIFYEQYYSFAIDSSSFEQKMKLIVKELGENGDDKLREIYENEGCIESLN